MREGFMEVVTLKSTLQQSKEGILGRGKSTGKDPKSLKRLVTFRDSK